MNYYEYHEEAALDSHQVDIVIGSYSSADVECTIHSLGMASSSVIIISVQIMLQSHISVQICVAVSCYFYSLFSRVAPSQPPHCGAADVVDVKPIHVSPLARSSPPASQLPPPSAPAYSASRSPAAPQSGSQTQVPLGPFAASAAGAQPDLAAMWSTLEPEQMLQFQQYFLSAFAAAQLTAPGAVNGAAGLGVAPGAFGPSGAPAMVRLGIETTTSTAASGLSAWHSLSNLKIQQPPVGAPFCGARNGETESLLTRSLARTMDVESSAYEKRHRYKYSKRARLGSRASSTDRLHVSASSQAALLSPPAPLVPTSTQSCGNGNGNGNCTNQQQQEASSAASAGNPETCATPPSTNASSSSTNAIDQFPCEVCPKRFRSECTLRRHLVAAHPERCFPCRYCHWILFISSLTSSYKCLFSISIERSFLTYLIECPLQ